MTAPILVFRHIVCEQLGSIADCLDGAGLPWRCVDLWQGEAEPRDLGSAAGLIFLGGPMSANDDLPYLRREIQIIQKAAANGVPVLGVCLGAQLIAKALGSRVYKSRVKEIGWFPVSWTQDAREDALFAGLGEPETVFHWHGETFDLPEGAVRLAESEACPNQAFRYGRRVYGLQFHLEVMPEMIVEWRDAEVNREDIRGLKRVKDAVASGKPLPLALREARAWGAKERLFERAVGVASEAALAELLAAAQVCDGLVKGLRHPDWPADAWDGLKRLVLMACERIGGGARRNGPPLRLALTAEPR
jgi:GMP synthase-like glutamine amidotransferase